MKRAIGAALAALALGWAGSAGASTFILTGNPEIIANTPGENAPCRSYSVSCINIGDGLLTITNNEFVTDRPWADTGDWAAFRFDYRHDGSGGDQNFFAGYTYLGQTHKIYLTALAGDNTFHLASINFFSKGLGSGYIDFFVGSDDPDGPVIDNFNITVAHVPEPATWAMMILGFGAVGSAIRASRRRPAAQAA